MLVKVNYDLSAVTNKYNKMLAQDGDIMRAMEQKVMKDIVPYVPFRTGELQMSASNKPGTGRITWFTPYALYIWHGKTIKGEPMVFDRSVNSLAGPRFTETYKANHAQELKSMIIKGVNRR